MAKKVQDKPAKTAKAGKAKKPGKAVKASKAGKPPKPAKPAKSAKRNEGHPALHAAARKLAELASSPVVAEVAAATLVAAAAALRDPKQARAIADSARNELSAIGKQAVGKSSAFWTLALDVAKRSMDAIADEASGKGRSKPKK
ncbi:MAG: hypothetical protein ABIW16_04495 [Sphingomicrobium sp.]